MKFVTYAVDTTLYTPIDYGPTRSVVYVCASNCGNTYVINVCMCWYKISLSGVNALASKVAAVMSILK